MSTKCRHCGSTSYGSGCFYLPTKKHEHSDDEKHCRIQESLRKSLLFYMSLGSKELFHSNTWAWLMEADEEFARIFFPSIPQNVAINIKREEKNRDLTIWVNKGASAAKEAYVIENKFKSIPRKGQLVQYKKEVGAFFKKGVLTGIVEPSWMTDKAVSDWSFLSYQEISEKMCKIAETSASLSDYHKAIIEDYCAMLKNMTDLLSEFLNEHESKFLTTDDCKELAKVRLEDITAKLSAEKFADWLRKQKEVIQLEQRVQNTGLRLFISTDYMKKHPIVDIRIVQDDREEDEIMKDHYVTSPWLFGVQIENDSYGRCVQVGNQTKKADGQPWSSPEIFERFRQIKWLQSRDALKNVRPGRRVEYGKYERAGKYSFVYQPEVIRNRSYSSLKKKIVQDMQFACELVKRVQRTLEMKERKV